MGSGEEHRLRCRNRDIYYVNQVKQVVENEGVTHGFHTRGLFRQKACSYGSCVGTVAEIDNRALL